MKKIIPIILLLLLLPAVFAQFPAEQFYGQNQFYYVIFDGEGEASVVARFDIQDLDEIKGLELEIPGKNIRVISVAQEWYSFTERCRYYEEVYDEENDIVIQTCKETYKQRVYPAKYAEVDYETTILSDSIKLDLEIPKTDQETVSILVQYKTESYVEEKGGVYVYDFETITNKYDTGIVRASIDVAEDLYHKSVDSEIEYRDNIQIEVASDMAEYATIIPTIQTGYTETASGLDPYESFHVTGKYANSWWSINWWKPLLSVLVLVLVLGGLAFAITTLYRRREGKSLFSISTGLISGVLIGLSWISIGYILQNSRYIFGYSNIIPTFLIVLTVMLSLFLLSGPSLFVGWSKGTKYGIYCLATTMVTAFFLIVVGLILLIILTAGPSGPIYPVAY